MCYGYLFANLLIFFALLFLCAFISFAFPVSIPLSSLPFFHTLPSVLTSFASSFFLSLPLSFFFFCLTDPPAGAFSAAAPFSRSLIFSFSVSNHTRLGRDLISSSCSMRFMPRLRSRSVMLRVRSSFSSLSTSSISSSRARSLTIHRSVSSAGT